jgi:hypothetical protein
MRRNIGSYVVAGLVGVLLVPSPAFAQQAGSRTSGPALATVAAEHAAKKQAHRQTVLNVLDRAEVRVVAKGAGLRIDKVASAVATLNGAELAQVAEQAKHVEEALAGGGLSGADVVALILIFVALLLFWGWYQMSNFLEFS